jgi:hypothetical protein
VTDRKKWRDIVRQAKAHSGRFLKDGREIQRESPRTGSVISLTARIQHCCVLCYFGLEEIKKESNVGHFENG